MTLRDQMVRAAVLNHQLQSARERLAAAMRVMEYEAALKHQIEVHDLERKLDRVNKPSRRRAVSQSDPANSNVTHRLR